MKAASGSVAAQLQRLITTTETLEIFLEEVVSHAAATFSGSTEVLAGVVLIRDKEADTVASSSSAAKQLDELQYGVGEGPSLYAVRTGETIVVDDVGTDTRWPAYSRAVRDRGVHSMLAVPLLIGSDGGAALNLYAAEPGAFGQALVASVQDYAAEAATALQLAVQLAGRKSAAGHLRAAMESRTTIDIAVGIVMAQNRCSQKEAFNILRQASSNQNIKLRYLASRVVESMNPDSVQTHYEN